MINNLPRCLDSGYLVGPQSELPTDKKVYYKDRKAKIIGCNRVFCSRCNQFVRHWLGYDLVDPPLLLNKADFAKIYQTKNPNESPYLKKSDQYRLYTCNCWADSISVRTNLYKQYIDFDYWGCGGHPQ